VKDLVVNFLNRRIWPRWVRGQRGSWGQGSGNGSGGCQQGPSTLGARGRQGGYTGGRIGEVCHRGSGPGDWVGEGWRGQRPAKTC